MKITCKVLGTQDQLNRYGYISGLIDLRLALEIESLDQIDRLYLIEQCRPEA